MDHKAVVNCRQKNLFSESLKSSIVVSIVWIVIYPSSPPDRNSWGLPLKRANLWAGPRFECGIIENTFLKKLNMHQIFGRHTFVRGDFASWPTATSGAQFCFEIQKI